MATNHGVGGSNPSSPTTGPKGKDPSLWGEENHDRDSGSKAMELGCGSFVEMEWPYFFFLFIVNEETLTYSMPNPNQHIFLFYAP